MGSNYLGYLVHSEALLFQIDRSEDGCGYLKKRLPPPDFLLAFTIIVQAISNLEVEDRMRGLAPNLSPLGLHLAWLVAKFICSNLASFLHLAGWLGERASCLPLGTYMAGDQQ